MGQAPEEEEGKGEHGNATINTLCIPKVIIEVGMPPAAKINGYFKKPLPQGSDDPAKARDVTLNAKKEFAHCREATSMKKRYASMLITTSMAPRIEAIA
jgi:hypothetical protein